MLHRPSKTRRAALCAAFALLLCGAADLDAGLKKIAQKLAIQDPFEGERVTIMVTGFVERTSGRPGALSPHIESGLSEALVGIEGFRVLERERLEDTVVKEQERALSDGFDDAAAEKLGKLAGADGVLTGYYAAQGDEVKIVGRIVSVTSGEVLAVARANVATQSLPSGTAPTVAVGADSRGIIAEPKTPADWYHNARMHELNGDFKRAREAYEAYVRTDQPFWDPHERLMAMMKHAFGIGGARKLYRKLRKSHGQSPIVRLASAMLEERPKRLKQLEALAQDDDAGPLPHWFLARQYARPELEDPTHADVLIEHGHLERFMKAVEAGEVLGWYIDKREGERLVEQAKGSFMRFSPQYLQMLREPVRIAHMPLLDKPRVPFMLMITVMEQGFHDLRYGLEGCEKQAADTPRMHPGTTLKIPNTRLEMRRPPPGNYTLHVCFKDRHEREQGPVKVAFEVPDKARGVELEVRRVLGAGLKPSAQNDRLCETPDKLSVKMSLGPIIGGMKGFPLDRIGIKAGWSVDALQTLELDAREYTRSYDLPALPAGQHTLHFEVRAGDHTQRFEQPITVLPPYAWLRERVEHFMEFWESRDAKADSATRKGRWNFPTGHFFRSVQFPLPWPSFTYEYRIDGGSLQMLTTEAGKKPRRVKLELPELTQGEHVCEVTLIYPDGGRTGPVKLRFKRR